MARDSREAAGAASEVRLTGVARRVVPVVGLVRALIYAVAGAMLVPIAMAQSRTPAAGGIPGPSIPPVGIQARATRSMFSVEASPFCGALGVAHRIAPDRWFGVEAGGGIPETHTQLADRDASWLELLHAGCFLRMAPDDHAGLEIGLRTGIADRCESGSCEFDPGVYGGASLALLLGWRHWKLGPRVTVARFGQQGNASRWEAWASPVNIWFCTEW